jgi:hypothetical protein
LNKEVVENLVYVLPGKSMVQLHNGTGTFIVEEVINKAGEKEVIEGTARLEEGVTTFLKMPTGEQAALVSVRVNTGGTGNWSHIYLVVAELGGVKVYPQSIVALGEDRSRIEEVTWEKDQITLNLRVHGPNDGACCPSWTRADTYKIKDRRLEVVKVVLPTPIPTSTLESVNTGVKSVCWEELDHGYCQHNAWEWQNFEEKEWKTYVFRLGDEDKDGEIRHVLVKYPNGIIKKIGEISKELTYAAAFSEYDGQPMNNSPVILAKDGNSAFRIEVYPAIKIDLMDNRLPTLIKYLYPSSN